VRVLEIRITELMIWFYDGGRARADHEFTHYEVVRLYKPSQYSVKNRKQRRSVDRIDLDLKSFVSRIQPRIKHAIMRARLRTPQQYIRRAGARSVKLCGKLITMKDKYNLLSLDGGGVRGLSSLFILKLMEEIDPDCPPKPCEVFDLIGGTSTGG